MSRRQVWMFHFCNFANVMICRILQGELSGAKTAAFPWFSVLYFQRFSNWISPQRSCIKINLVEICSWSWIDIKYLILNWLNNWVLNSPYTERYFCKLCFFLEANFSDWPFSLAEDNWLTIVILSFWNIDDLLDLGYFHIFLQVTRISYFCSSFGNSLFLAKFEELSCSWISEGWFWFFCKERFIISNYQSVRNVQNLFTKKS